MQLTAPPVIAVEPIRRVDVVRFAGASGDFNPIHFDDDAARAVGFSRAFAMGHLVAGMVSSALLDVVGAAHTEERIDLSVKFLAPVWLDEPLTVNLDPAGADRHRITFAVSSSGRQALRGELSVGAPSFSLNGCEEPAATDGRLQRILQTDLAPLDLPVEHGQVVQFSRAIRATIAQDGAPLALRSGIGAAPITFSCSAAHWDTGDALDLPRSLGLDVARVMHGSHRWRSMRRMQTGERYVGARRVCRVCARTSRSGEQLTIIDVETIWHGTDQAEPCLAETMSVIEVRPGTDAPAKC